MDEGVDEEAAAGNEPMISVEEAIHGRGIFGIIITTEAEDVDDDERRDDEGQVGTPGETVRHAGSAGGGGSGDEEMRERWPIDTGRRRITSGGITTEAKAVMTEKGSAEVRADLRGAAARTGDRFATKDVVGPERRQTRIPDRRRTTGLVKEADGMKAIGGGSVVLQSHDDHDAPMSDMEGTNK